jgi:hypothetical protein
MVFWWHETSILVLGFVTLSKLECSNQMCVCTAQHGITLYDFGVRRGSVMPKVILSRDIRRHLYLLERGEILRPSKDKQVRKHLPSVCLLIKDESWGIEDD